MSDRPSQPAGTITRISVTYTVDTGQGLRHTFHGLPRMRRHIRAERLAELLDDLTLICEDLLSQPAQPASATRPATAARQPAGRHLRAVE